MIVISKDRIYHEYFKGGMKVMVDIAQTNASLVRYLTEVVHVESDVTVEDVLRHLIDYQEDISFAMESSLGGYMLQPFLDEIIKDVPKEDHLLYAEFCHEANVIDGTLVYAPRFGAIGKDIAGNTDNELPYTVELAAIGSYKHLTIVLNRDYEVTKIDEVDGKQIDTVLFTGQKEFTLYELLHALLFEISYYGTPDMRAGTLQEVITNIGGGDNFNMSLAQVEHLKTEEIGRLEAELEESVKNEDYEKSAEIRDRIAQLKRERTGPDPGTNTQPEV